MEKFFSNVVDQHGEVVRDALITVTDETGALATLFSDNGVTPQTNPFAVGALGFYSFYAANGRYNVQVAGPRFAGYTIADVLLQDLEASSGTVTNVSVTTANGFAGSVANPTRTPAITLSTTVANGMLKAASGALVPAVAGTDYGMVQNSGTLTANALIVGNGTTQVKAVALTGIVKANGVGAPTAAVAADFPTLNQNTTGTAAGLSATLAVTSGGTGLTTFPALSITVASALNTLSTLVPGAGQSVRINAAGTAWEVYTPASGGSVTGVSVVTANGFGGSVANPSSTPAITLTTSVSGLLKGNGTGVAAAVANVDYADPSLLQNSQSANYTLVLGDAGKQIYHPSADTTARTFTIPANASVAFPIGTCITFVNDSSAGVITLAITSDTMVQAGTGTTGSRTLAANGVATAFKVGATRWFVSGTGLT